MSSWEATYRALREQFVLKAGEWLDEAGRLSNSLEREPENGAAFERLSVVFHRIAGTAGTYGFARVSELADEGELVCVTLTREGRLPTSEDLALLRRLADAMRERMNDER